MVALIARLFCAAALASVAVGTLPSLSIVSPANYTAFKAGEAFDLTLKITAPSDLYTELALVVGCTTYPFGGVEGITEMGIPQYHGTFIPGWEDSESNWYQNITVLAPDWTNGNTTCNVARLYANTLYADLTTELLYVIPTIYGATG